MQYKNLPLCYLDLVGILAAWHLNRVLLYLISLSNIDKVDDDHNSRQEEE